MILDEVFNGPSSMETQPGLAPVKVLEEGVAGIQDGRTVEWWPVEEPEQMANTLEYLEDENKPLHTNFVLPNQGLALCYTCPVFLEVFRASRLWRKPCVTRYTAKYSISGEPLAVVVD